MNEMRLSRSAGPRDVIAMWHIAYAMLAFGCALVLGGLIMADVPIGMLRWAGVLAEIWTVPLGARAVLGVMTVACGFGASMHMLGTALRLLNGGGLLPQMQLPPAYFKPRVPVLIRA
ncbi:MAG: hypothetical protein H0X64_06480 [Gemmatimonadaceae bacterium]|nr:hypothetical protein [Gemmatimonadaceae bacterium]